jgi:hypothetical protein
MIVLQSHMTGAAIGSLVRPKSTKGMSSPGGEEAGEGEPYSEIGRAVSPRTAVPVQSFLCAFASLREIPFSLVSWCLLPRRLGSPKSDEGGSAAKAGGGEKTVCPSLPKIKPIKPKSNRFFKNHPNSTLDLGCLKSSSLVVAKQSEDGSSTGFSIRVHPWLKTPLFAKRTQLCVMQCFDKVQSSSNGRPTLSNLIQTSPTILRKK